MSLQNITVVAEVPEDQTIAAETAAAAFVKSLPADAQGSVVVSATFGGQSLLPSPADRFQAARAAFDTLAAQSSIKPAELKAALAELDDATAAYELSLLPAAQAPASVYSPPPVPAAAVVVDQATVEQTVAAPTGDEPTPAGLPDVPAPMGDEPAAG